MSPGQSVSVIGTGYLGVVHAACMADLGHHVVAVDVDADKIRLLAAGTAPFHEPGLDELLRRVLPTGRLSFTTDYSAVNGARVHFLCVGTPQRSGHAAADLSYLWSAVDSLAPYLSPDDLVVGKSTVPVGTAVATTERLARLTGRPVRVAWNPEFLREGFAIEDTLRPNRLVYGVAERRADDVAALDAVYAQLLGRGCRRLVTDLATAELVKGAANGFLSMKISFINAMADVCEGAGADVVELAEALGLDDRIGRRFLGAGIGFGGGCLPKDLRAFSARARELEAVQAAELLELVDQINLARRTSTLERVRQLVGGDLVGRCIAVLGAAFKPDSDDIRDSPALEIAQALADGGARVRVHDPAAVGPARRQYPDLTYVATVPEAVEASDAVLHLTEWREYRELDPGQLRPLVAHPVVFDGRNVLDRDRWRGAGWVYVGVGRGDAGEREKRA